MRSRNKVSQSLTWFLLTVLFIFSTKSLLQIWNRSMSSEGQAQFAEPTLRPAAIEVFGEAKKMSPRTALIIGAKQGIGFHLAKKLHARGWMIYGSVRSLKNDEDAIKKSGLEDFATEIFEVDVLDEETIQSAASKFGEKRLDLLIHCAGLGPNPDATWDHTANILMEKFRVNTVGPYLTAKHFFPALKRSDAGKIINMASNMGSLSSRDDNRRGGSLGYRLSKTALNQLTVSLSRAFQHQETTSQSIVYTLAGFPLQ